MNLIAVLILLLGGAVAAAAERPQDFAYAIAIHADARDALYEIEIPASVYRGVTRSDLGDIRVFNAQGEVVPHAFKPSPTGGMEKPATVELPRFPLYAEAGASIEDLNVRVEKRSDGTIINVSSRAKGGDGKTRLRGYLLDASSLKQPLRALLFDWRSVAEGFAGKIRIEGSDDLARWSLLTDNAPLVSLEFGGHSLQQKRVELRAPKVKFLRVSWPQTQRSLDLSSVRAEPAGRVVEAQRVWQTFSGSPVASKTGEYTYDLGGHFTFDRMRIELPQVNTVAQLQVLARAKSSEDWRPVTSAVIYRLRHDGEEVTSPEVAVASSGERYWMLRVDQKGGGMGAGIPGIHIGWLPQRMVFTARGEGPFQLAYGNSAAKPASFAINSLIPGYKTDSEFKIKIAVLGEQITLAGAARLRERIDYKKWALWASLILGVLALGWMVYRLSRQMNRSDPDETKDSTSGNKPK
jgi:hypothetical protein